MDSVMIRIEEIRRMLEWWCVVEDAVLPLRVDIAWSANPCERISASIVDVLVMMGFEQLSGSFVEIASESTWKELLSLKVNIRIHFFDFILKNCNCHLIALCTNQVSNSDEEFVMIAIMYDPPASTNFGQFWLFRERFLLRRLFEERCWLLFLLPDFWLDCWCRLCRWLVRRLFLLRFELFFLLPDEAVFIFPGFWPGFGIAPMKWKSCVSSTSISKPMSCWMPTKYPDSVSSQKPYAMPDFPALAVLPMRWT